MFFKNYGVNPFVDTEDDHLSTFAIDVDSGSYTLCRSYLQQGNLPSRDAVRVEEFVNYFDYDYPAPRQDAFAVYFEAMPWQFGAARKNTHLMRIGLKALEIPDENRKPAILTFVIDVSGSMSREDRLGLVKQSLALLVDKLRADDKIGIAVYGSQGREILSHTGLNNKQRIMRAIRSLESEGSTNAEEGIRIGYDMAEEAFVPGYINRVILCSDGVANVGATGPEQILKIIKDKADKGITLSALGFGMGNYNDVLMEQLGNKGNGYYAYIDTLDQAKRLFSNLTGALQVVARDVKVQVDFNPDIVRSYRLIGYENRDVADVDFRNDIVDGGEIGAGHSTTALYELKLWPQKEGNIATTYVRYKDADTFAVSEFSARFETSQIAAGTSAVSDSFALASVVTQFAEILRQSYWAKGANLADTLAKARQLTAAFENNADVTELVELMTRTNDLLAKTADSEDALEPASIEYRQP
ncbi:MAG: von Willebrand factor type A domain-containing protein [Planctomycetaceae bacterium]|nr:von Willebrand factor type A domain-containing protein [Planctomycetaceae bacterium]